MKVFVIKKPEMTSRDIQETLEEISLREFGKNIFNPISNNYLNV